MERFTVTTVAHEADQQPFTLPITVEAEDLADALYHFESKYFFETRYQLPVGDALFVIPLDAVKRIEIRRAADSHE